MRLLGVWHAELLSGQIRSILLGTDAIVARCKESTAFRNSLLAVAPEYVTELMKCCTCASDWCLSCLYNAKQ